MSSTSEGLSDLRRLAERLRAPDGCPWDREQTHRSLRPHLLEETYEALEALDAGDDDALADELGDLLFQIVIHAEIAREAGAFDLADIERRIVAKLIRRHPHVFADRPIEDDLLAQWERLKRDEHPSDPPRSVVDGIPAALPALFAAERLQERAARVHLVRPRVQLPFDIDDEACLGDLLFDLVAEAREHGFDAETALRAANARFVARVARVEAVARTQGRSLEAYAADELARLWEDCA